MQRKYLVNVFFLSLEHITRIVLNIWVLSIIARTFGPGDFGELNYIKGIVIAISVIAKFGLEHVVMKLFLDDRYSRDNVLSSALFISIMSAISAYVIVTMFSYILNDSIDWRIQTYSLIYFFEILFIVEYYFASQVNSKVLIRFKVLLIAVSSFFKIGIATYLPNVAIFDVLCVDIVYSLILSTFYISNIGRFKLSIEFDLVKKMTLQAIPLLFSSVAIIVFTKSDQIMIGKMLGMHQNGLYSAAVSIVFAMFILPAIISNTIYPKIVSDIMHSEEKLNKSTLLQLELLNVCSFIVILTVSLFSEKIIIIVFGDNYFDSISVLKILLFSFLFTSLGVGSNKWLLAKNLEKIIFYRTFSSAVINVVLNFILIPKYGISGAAFASLVSMAMSGLFMNAIFRSSRPLFILQIKSFLFVESNKYVKKNYVEYTKK